ncbi:MAG: DUF1838 family protein [Rhodospirillales bacterium]|jgi:hypothetical protein
MSILPTLSRRDTFLFAASAAAASTPSMPTLASSVPAELNWDDPAERVRIQSAMKGSSGEETIYSFFRLHLYGYTHSGNLIPFATMSNFNVGKWRTLPNGNQAAKVFEAGVYTKFDSDEVLEVWENPVTGEKRKPWRFIGGPLSVEIGPDGMVTGDLATLKPKPLQLQVFGDTVMIPSASAFSFPNPMTPEAFPKESAGDTYWWDSHYVYFANLKDVVNREITSVQSHIQFQNLVSWHPWWGMGGQPGRTWGRAYGAKISGPEQIPAAYLKAFEDQTPEIFDTDNWTEPRDDFPEYMADRHG